MEKQRTGSNLPVPAGEGVHVGSESMTSVEWASETDSIETNLAVNVVIVLAPQLFSPSVCQTG